MTNEEALKRFKWKYNLTKDYNDPHWEGGERREHCEWVEQLEIAINALEKQIPKKPLDVCTPVVTWGLCPTCKGELNKLGGRPNRVFQSNAFCPDCGQKLLWE